MSAKDGIDRRRVLEGLGLGALVYLLPGCGQSDDEALPSSPRETPAPEPEIPFWEREVGPNPYVEPALARARALGKPLLVLVAPGRRDDARWEREGTFGEFLRLCSDDALVDLALCEVLCATVDELEGRVVVPQDARDGHPLLLLVGVDGTVSTVANDLPTIDAVRRDAVPAGYEAAVRARVAVLERHVHDLVAPTPEAFAALVASATRRLGRERLERIDDARDGELALDPRTADECAAVVRAGIADAEPDGGARERLLASLLDGTKLRLREGPPYGARWATSWGCGGTIEPVPDHHAARRDGAETHDAGISCGMGFVPEISRRFLSFWGTPQWS
jgi:hypothetical protein